MTDKPSDGPNECPTDEELGDETATVDTWPPWHVDPDDFDDVNECAGAEWAAITTPEDRVKAVVGQANMPDTVAEIADAAVVSRHEAKHILNAYDDEGKED